MKKKVGARKRLGRWIGSLFIWLIARLASFLPLGCSRFLCRRAGDLLFFGWRRRREIALGNLRLAFGKFKSEREIKAIARRSFRNLLVGLGEGIRFVLLPIEHLERELIVDGRKLLNRALAEGKGVIVFTAHLGCFPLIGRKFASEGIPFSYVIRFLDDVRATGYLKKLGERVKVGFISAKPQHRCVSQCLKALRRNEIVCLLGDQYAKEGVKVNFFGHPAPTAAGPVVLSLRTGARIVPMFIVRRANNKYCLYIEPPFPLEITGKPEKDIIENMDRLTKVIESYVRRYPDQWAWIHRRWRQENLVTTDKHR